MSMSDLGSDLVTYEHDTFLQIVLQIGPKAFVLFPERGEQIRFKLSHIWIAR